MNTGSGMRTIALAVATMVAGLCAACSGDETAADVRSPFGPVTTTTTFGIGGNVPNYETTPFLGGVVGEKVIAGKSFHRFRVGYDVTTVTDLGKPDAKATEVWFGKPDKDTVVVAGFQEHGGTTFTLDTPVTFNLLPPVGETKTLVVQGMATSPDKPTPAAATVTAVATLTDPDVEVDTRMGHLTHCRRYDGSLTISGPGAPAIVQDLPITVQVWYHPDLGIVAGNLPDLGMDMGLTNESDYGDVTATSGSNTIRKVGNLTGTTTSFNLSTYDRRQEYDATKFEHAKMFVELRWANDADALTLGAPSAPSVQFELGDMFGVFLSSGWGSTLTQSPLSIFHPEENGKGYKYWYAYASEADRYQPGADGIEYHVSVTKDASVPALRVTARIAYQLFDNGGGAVVTK